MLLQKFDDICKNVKNKNEHDLVENSYCFISDMDYIEVKYS